MGILINYLFSSGNPYNLYHLNSPFSGFFLSHMLVKHQNFGYLKSYGKYRIQRRHRLLKYH